jgi:hypothetical protein
MHLARKNTEISLNFNENFKNTLIASVAHARPLLEGLKFFDENSKKKKIMP